MSACNRCERPVSDATICNHCKRDLERVLCEIPWLERELELTIARLSRFTEASDGGRSAETPVSYHLAASQAASNLRAILVSWVRLTMEESEETRWPRDTMASMSRHLVRLLPWLRQHDAAAELVDEIQQAVWPCRRIVDTPTNRTTFDVGPCPETWDGGTSCDGIVRAFIPASDDDQAHMACNSCQTRWEAWQWLRLGPRIIARKEQEARLANLRRAVLSEDA